MNMTEPDMSGHAHLHVPDPQAPFGQPLFDGPSDRVGLIDGLYRAVLTTPAGGADLPPGQGEHTGLARIIDGALAGFACDPGCEPVHR